MINSSRNAKQHANHLHHSTGRGPAATEKIAKVRQQDKSVCDLLTVWADLRGNAVGDRYTYWRIM